MGTTASPLSILQAKSKSKKKLAKWNAKVSDDDIVNHVVDQVYESDMTTWEETQDNEKTWIKCQTFFEAAYTARKWYIDAKSQTSESRDEFTEADFNMYLNAIKLKATQENKVQ